MLRSTLFTKTLNKSAINNCYGVPYASSSTNVLVHSRSVYVYSKPKYKRKALNKFNLNIGLDHNKQSVDLINDNDSDKVILAKFKNLQKLTNDLQKKLNSSKNSPVDQSLQTDDQSNHIIRNEEREIEQIYKQISSDKDELKRTQQEQKLQKQLLSSSSYKKNVSLFDTLSQNAPKLPESIEEKLGNSVIHISSKFAQDWLALVEEMHTNDPDFFKGLPLKDIEDFIATIPNGERLKCMHLLNEMLSNSNIKKTQYIYDLNLAGIAYHCKPDTLHQAETVYDNMLSSGRTPRVHTYGNLFKAVSKSARYFVSIVNHDYRLPFAEVQKYKNNHLGKINKFLSDMKKFNLKPNLVIYTNILQACVILEDYDQAIEIFDLCKFHNFKLDVAIYNSVILIEIKRNNLERVLDLYQEMLENAVKPNGETYLLLARTCSLSDKHLLEAWNFLLKHFDLEKADTLNERVVKIMMLLASKDSDILLSRILFLQIFKRYLAAQKDPGPEFLNMLLETYKNYDPIEHNPQRFMSVMLSNEPTKNLRRNLINSIDFQNLYLNNMAHKLDENMITDKQEYQLPPMLPVYDLQTSRQVMEEARAIWFFMLSRFPKHINVHNASSYLKVFVNHGETIDDFIQKYDEVTYFDDEGLEFPQYLESQKITFENANFGENSDRKDEESTDQTTSTLNNTSDSTSLKNIKQTPEIIDVSADFQKSLRIPRTNAFYKLALVASTKFKNFEFMQKVWIERGQFRKTSRFKNLSIAEKNKLDFEFAREMCQALLALGLVHDALNIVLSTENQFQWSFYYLKNLYLYAEKIGDEYTKRRVKQVAYKHRGIDSQSFKEYNAKRYS